MEEGLAPGRPNRGNIFVKNSHDVVHTVRRSNHATKEGNPTPFAARVRL